MLAVIVLVVWSQVWLPGAGVYRQSVHLIEIRAAGVVPPVHVVQERSRHGDLVGDRRGEAELVTLGPITRDQSALT